jgi:hypothetical protein
MSHSSPQQSNPFSTGGGGPNFETRIQAAFTVLMLTGRVSPCLPPWPIVKLRLQGSYAGYKTDDFIVFTKDRRGEEEAKLLAQIKHEVTFAETDETFTKVIAAAWGDFNDPTIFRPGIDALALITGPLSAKDINHTRTLLEWARHCANESEFLDKVKTKKFSSAAKQAKLQAFKVALSTANGGTSVSDKQFWEFLKSYHLLGYDLDTENGGTLSLLQSLIGHSSNQDPATLWSQIVNFVQSANQNAGTVTLETLPGEIRNTFKPRKSQWDSDLRKLEDHAEYIVNGIRTSICGVHIKRSELFSQLLEASETSKFVFIVGGRGSGKSSLVKEFSVFMKDRAPVFCLRAEDLDHAHLDNVFSSMRLESSIRDIEAGFALMPKRYLLLESIEKLLELQNTSAFSDLLQFLNTHLGWTVIATGRDYAYQPIVFNYLQPSGLRHAPLAVTNFNAEEVQTLCESLQSLRTIVANASLKPLLHNPFFAELAYRVSEAGTEFTASQGEKEFRVAVWRGVIAKEQERISGMPLKRKQTFVDMAVARAKRMVYGVPEGDFDSEAVLKLEDDDLVRRDLLKGVVSPAHDVLEDWALERFIEDIYQQLSHDVPKFLEGVGNEPAMNRAFRLWLYQKLRLGDDVKGLILDVLENPNLQRYWQDETISAVLLSDNPYGFLSELGDRLFDSEAELLKRFCFILRISCKTPNQDLMRELGDDKPGAYLFLQPHGLGWSAVVRFLFENKENLPAELNAHVIAILEEWCSSIHIEAAKSETAREAGLLALWLLDPLKNAYHDDDEAIRNKILRVVVRTVASIPQEFDELLHADVFNVGCRRRQHYVDDFCTMALDTFDSAHLCKHVPDSLIKLAFKEFFIIDSGNDPNESWHADVEDCFGLNRFKHEFFPPSGSKGLFRHLLRFHPRQGLDFILQLLNTAASKYAQSDLDSPDRDGRHRNHQSASSGEQIEIILEDQTSVKQFCSGRLWMAYRGHSVVPYLLQSALMALENWLISLAEEPSSRKVLEWVFNHILSNSNSVMPTAVLASVATGFPNLLGKAALPILRTPAVYELDMLRIVQERGGSEINWFASALRQEPYANLYTDERRRAAIRPWRKEHLETLLTRLQFTDLREQALAVVDDLRLKAPQVENWRFRFHRVDSRSWKAVEDRANNRIVFEPQSLAPDLEIIQEQSQESMALHERFLRMHLWSAKEFERETLDREYYANWHEALGEAKNLAAMLNENADETVSRMFIGSVVKAAAVFLRNNANEVSKEDASWCADIVVRTVTSNADVENAFASSDKSDFDGVAAAASVIPILLDRADSDEEKLLIKKWIATALTHVNGNARAGVANGVREHLWQRDPEFAQHCMFGAIDYSRLQVENSYRRTTADVFSDDAGPELSEWVGDFRERLATRGISLSIGDIENLQFQTHSPWYMLAPCFMIPDGSTDPAHIAFFSRMLDLFFEAEQSTRRRRSDRVPDDIYIHGQLRLTFTRRFAEYLVVLRESGSQLFTDKLVMGCELAPEFIDHLLTCFAFRTESVRKHELYWRLWSRLSNTVQARAMATAESEDHRRENAHHRTLIRGMLHADAPWGKLDYEREDIAGGKQLILEFVTNAGKNTDVFEALCSLMYHFPKIFFESGIHILARHQSEVGGTRLFSGVNTAFYLEASIQRFLQIDQTGPLSKEMHQSCFTLVDALVETASSRAYYLREQLIHSRRIL